MRTLSGQRSADEIIVVTIERSGNRDVDLQLDFEDQDLVFNELMVLQPPTSIDMVFDKLKPQVDQKNPLLKLRRGEVDVKKIATYTGFLRQLWEHTEPHPDDELIQLLIDEYYGIDVMIRDFANRSDSGVSFNANEQRFVHSLAKQNLAIARICESLHDLQTKESQSLQNIRPPTVRVLKNFIARQVQQPPQGQSDHWARVNAPYNAALGDVATTVHQRPPQAPSTLAPPPRPATGRSASPSDAAFMGRSNQPGKS